MHQQHEVVPVEVDPGVVGAGVEVGLDQIENLVMGMRMDLLGVMAAAALVRRGMLVNLLRGSVEVTPRKGSHTVVVGAVDTPTKRLWLTLDLLHGGFMSDAVELAAVMR